MTKTLDELRLAIAQYAPMVDTPADQYAHNIVSLTLSMIDKGYGRAAANEAIDDFGLEALGWSKRGDEEEEQAGEEYPEEDPERFDCR